MTGSFPLLCSAFSLSISLPIYRLSIYPPHSICLSSELVTHLSVRSLCVRYDAYSLTRGKCHAALKLRRHLTSRTFPECYSSNRLLGALERTVGSTGAVYRLRPQLLPERLLTSQVVRSDRVLESESRRGKRSRRRSWREEEEEAQAKAWWTLQGKCGAVEEP